MVTLELLTSSQIVVFNIPSEFELVYSAPLKSLLGLTHPTKYCRGPRKYRKYHMNLNRGIAAIYVYSDVIQTKLVSDSVCHSLVSFLFVVSSGKWRSKSIILQCTLLWQTCIFHKRNVHNGQRRKTCTIFSGKVTVLLHFKHKDD